MKLNKYIGLAAMAVAFTACQQDMLEGEIQQNGIYTLSGEMGGGETMSRAQIVLGNTDGSKESFMWNDGDAFTLYQENDGNYTEHVFQISDYSEEGDGDKKQATFVTNNPAAPGEVIAVYPSGLNMELNQGIMTVAIDFQKELDFSQKSVEEVWKDYFRNNMVMKAKATLSDSGDNSLHFQHLTSLARITYHNQSGKDQQVTDIELGGDQAYGYLMTVWFKYDIIGGNYSNGYKVTYKNLTIKAGESFDFYILFGPRDFGEGDMHLHIHTAETDSNRSPLTLPIATIAAANSEAEGFEAGKRYWFKVTETEDGLAWTKDVSSDVVTIKNVGFARALDWYFNRIGEGESITLDENGYATIDKELVEKTTYLWTGDSDRQNTFTTLDGIEHFVNLQIIKSAYGALEECDFSKNKYLKEVYLQNNNLKSLDFSGNTGLEVLYCVNNRNLTSVDLSRNNHLKNVSVSTTGLSSLTIPNPAKVEVLGCSNLNLNTLGVDFTPFTALKSLTISNTKYDVASLPATLKNQLTSLTCSANGYTALDLSEFTSLTSLICSANNLTSLALPDIALNTLYCDQNQLSALDLSKLTTLEHLMCGNQQTGTLVLTLNDAQKEKWNSTWKANCNNVILEGEVLENVTIENAELSTALQDVLGSDNVTLDDNGYAVMSREYAESVTELIFEYNKHKITSLAGIENFVNLQHLRCDRTGLTECDLSQNKALISVDLCYQMLSKFVLNGMENLESVSLGFTQQNLTEVNLDNNINLDGINLVSCHNLTKLSIAGCSNLSSLDLRNTKVETVSIPNPSKITYLGYVGTLEIDWSKLTNLNTLMMWGMTDEILVSIPDFIKMNLRQLNCNQGQLTSLDLSKFENLRGLSCSENQLTTLDTSKNPYLLELDCADNRITNLDLTSNTSLKRLYCGLQTDDEGNDIVLELKLPDSLIELWYSEWKTENENVILITGPSVESGNGNTSGSDFTIEGIY